MKFDVNDIVGKKFNNLTVLKFSHSKVNYLKNGSKNGYTHFYLCQCKCGNQIIVARHHLIFNHTQSCGCLSIKHNLTNTRLFRIWTGMFTRCYNKNSIKYKIYGGRGIIVCKEWQEFEPFYNWSMSNSYKEGLSIDRIDVNGNYEPSNCRWVNMKTQQRNRTNNYLITFNNQTHPLNEWAEILNIKRETLKTRLNSGWSIEKTLTTPVRFQNPK